jgi:hypothetical protein
MISNPSNLVQFYVYFLQQRLSFLNTLGNNLKNRCHRLDALSMIYIVQIYSAKTVQHQIITLQIDIYYNHIK